MIMNKLYINYTTMDEKSFRESDLPEKILNYSSGFVVPDGKPEEESLELLLQSVHSTPGRLRVLHRNWLWAAAAVPLLALLYAGFSYLGQTRIHTDLAEHRSLFLPDQTEVILNADSKISFNKRHFSKERSVRLSGEAFLKVRKGNDFAIHTTLGDIRILGTELNILCRDTIFKVTCVSGRVKVICQDRTETIGPGENTELTRKGLMKKDSVDIEKTLSWRNGEFNFEDCPLVYIFNEIERQFNVSINSKGLGNRYFTGSFSNKNLREALNIVCIPMDLKYEFKERNKIMVTR
jgi:ferric-dicitrate binding protein FerR (iron transport regulator)